MDESKKSHNLLANIGLRIDEELKQKLCFQENLIISKFDNGTEFPNPIGGISLNIQAAQNDKYLVYVNSKFQVDSATGGSKITSWITPTLNTIEEKRVEYICGEKVQKQTLYLGARPDNLIVRHGPSEGGEILRSLYPYESVRDLICEGANLILLRALAIRKYVGEFELSTLYITGDLCRNIYTCTGPEAGTVNNIDQQVYKIHRTIIERCGLAHYCSATLTANGRFVNQQWYDCAYTIHVNPLLDVAEPQPKFFNTAPLAVTWRDDIELYSRYLDRTVLNGKLAESYLDDSPDLDDVLKDYVQHLLLHKPEEELVSFTTEYFQRYFKRFRN